MTPLSELEALARAATPGPWEVFEQPVADKHEAIDELVVLVGGTNEFSNVLPMLVAPNNLCPAITGCGKDGIPNAAFISAANPATILAMIELIRLQHEAIKRAFIYIPKRNGDYLKNDAVIEAFKKWEGE